MWFLIVPLALGAALVACGTRPPETAQPTAPQTDESAAKLAPSAPATTGASATQSPAARIRPEEIQQIIPRDAIPSIDNPQFVTGEEANRQYADDEQVLAVDVHGDRRVYSVRLLATREIVNDVVGGVPVAVTF